MSIYTKHLNNKNTPQTTPLLGKNQVKNNAGGFVFEADAEVRLMRFLMLGTEGGTYYVGEKELTVKNAKHLIVLIQAQGVKTVETIVQVSESGRAPKNDPAIFALALAATFGNVETKKAAYTAITKVCRTSTHLFTFNENVRKLRDSSSGLIKGIRRFYENLTDDQLAYQLVKYRQRNGWTHRDVLRLTHPKAVTESRNALYSYAVGKAETTENLPKLIQAFEAIQKTKDVKTAVALIQENKLPWEAVPTELLKHKEIWAALLPSMPLHALMRNLAKMTSIGVLTSGLDVTTKVVVSKLTDVEYVKKSRLHPMAILNALKIYSRGFGDKGSLRWFPVQKVVDALNDAFYLAFANVEATGANILVAVDCSGSMSAPCVGMTSLSAREAAGAMACIIANTEPNAEIMGFTDKFETGFRITPKMRLDDVMSVLNRISGGTNCAIPMNYAISKQLDVDAFVILTDNETWSGSNHPVEAFKQYRKLKSSAKLIGVGMTATEFDITDPNDMNSLSVAGFDTTVPNLIGDFVRG